jgi:hypothetical protein
MNTDPQDWLASIWQCWPLYGKARYLAMMATIWRRRWPQDGKARYLTEAGHYLAMLATIW